MQRIGIFIFIMLGLCYIFNNILSLFTLLFAGIFIALLVITFAKDVDKKYLVNIFLISLFIRLFFCMIFYIVSLYYYPKERQEFFIGDGIGYNHNGLWLSQMWTRGIFPDMETVRSISWSGTAGAYDYWNGFLFHTICASPFVVFILNCLFGSFSIIFIYLTARMLFNRDVARVASLFSAFWPSFILWSTQNLKDPIIIFLTSVGIWSMLSLVKRFRIRYVLTVSFAVYFLYVLKSIMMPIFLIILYIISIYLIFKIIKEIAGLGCGVICLIAFNILFLSILIKYLHTHNMLSYALEWINQTRFAKAYGNLAFLRNLNYTSILSIIITLPLTLFFVLFTPFPWQIGNITQIMAVPEMLIWYFLIPVTIKGAVDFIKIKKLEHMLLLIFIFLGLIFYAILEGNAGTLFRHRSTILILFFIVTAAGLMSKYKKYGKIV